jgi:hypothetical protein
MDRECPMFSGPHKIARAGAANLMDVVIAVKDLNRAFSARNVAAAFDRVSIFIIKKHVRG